MAIRLNYYLGTRNAEDGQVRLFGKVGYQTMGPKTDRFTNKNLADIEAALKAGQLKDLEGNVVQNGAVIDVYAYVSVVSEDDALETVGGIRNSAGGTAEVPAADAAAEDSDDPF